MFDLQAAVRDAFDHAKDSGAIDKAVDKTVGETVKTIVERELGAHSKFAKMVEVKVQQALELHGDLELPAYHTFVMECVKRHVTANIDVQIGAQLTKNLNHMLTRPADAIKLSELVAAFVEHAKSNLYDSNRDPETLRISIHWKREHGFAHLALDKCPKKGEYECDYRLAFHEDRCFSVDFKSSAGGTFGCRCSDFEKFIFGMRIAGTKLIVDREQFETEFYDPL